MKMKILKLDDFITEAQVGAYEITDMSSYLEHMSAGLSDKLYFLNKVDLDVLIDFGCADGILLNYISKVNKNIKLIGYDLDDRMINIASSKFSHIQFESKWNIIEDFLEKNKNLTIGILLSSVIHEVYSYSKSSTIPYFWKHQVFNSNINYVIIRDMMSSNSYPSVNEDDVEKIKQKANQKQLGEFEDEWGGVDKDYTTFLHWLLKYRYLVNWGRELYENYLPITIQHLKSKWIPSSWTIIFEDYFTFPYLKGIVKKDFDIDIKQPTHLKMIIKNKNKTT